MKTATQLLLEKLDTNHTLPSVMTVSAFIKRVLRYNLSPEIYSRIIERHLTDQVFRMYVTLRPMSVDRNLKPLSTPLTMLIYPTILQVDEYNLCKYTEHYIVAKASEQLQMSRLYYGDFAQSSPIRGTNDNAELVALYASLTVQFVDNKRLIGRRDTSNVRLMELLSDSVWNWRANNCNDGTDEYVRELIERCVARPLRDAGTPNTLRLRDDLMSEWYENMVQLLRWYDERRCRRYVTTRNTLSELLRRVPSLPLPCFIAKRNYDCDRVNYWISHAIADYVKRRCDRAAWENADAADLMASEIQADCFFLVTRRAALTTLYAWHENEKDIIKMESNELYDEDDIIKMKSNENGPDENDKTKSDDTDEDDNEKLDDTDKDNERIDNERRFIDDDPWCSELTLFIGGVYRYIGEATNKMSRDTLLRLIAFLPDNNDKRPPSYVCGRMDKDCDVNCAKPLESRSSFLPPRSLPLTKGCGLSTRGSSNTSFVKFPRLLMRKLITRDDDNTTWNSKDIVVVSRGTFTLNRCNSVWTKNMYTLEHKREGIVLFGYPLLLNCGVSTWRVQGETILKSDVYIDLKYMSKQQALVSLSRVRRNQQICGILNLNAYGETGL